MPRTDISLTSGELSEFLGHCRTAALAVQGDDGWPSATVVHPSFRGEQLSFEVDALSPLGQAIRAGARACLVADTWPSYHEIQGVIVRVHSPAAARPDPVEVSLTMAQLTSFDFGKAS